MSGPRDGHKFSPAFEHTHGIWDRRGVLAVQDYVVVFQHLFEILRLVVDDHICAQALHQLHICSACGCGNRGSQMLG